MFEVQILIPITSNGGEPFSASHFLAFEAAAVRGFGGITRLPAEVCEELAAEFVVNSDGVACYVVSLSSITDGGKLTALLVHAKSCFAWKAIQIRYLGVTEVM